MLFESKNVVCQTTVAIDSTTKKSDNYLQYAGWQRLFEDDASKPKAGIMNAGISVGWDIGVPTDMFVVPNGPGGNLFLNSQMTSDYLGLPLKLEGQYRQYSVKPETQNYLRASVDVQALKEKSDQARSAKLKEIGNVRKVLDERNLSLRNELVATRKAQARANSTLNTKDNFKGSVSLDNNFISTESFQELPDQQSLAISMQSGSALVNNTSETPVVPNFNNDSLDTSLNIDGTKVSTISELDSIDKDSYEIVSNNDDYLNATSGLNMHRKLEKSDSLENRISAIQEEINWIDQKLESLNNYERVISGGSDSIESKVSKNKFKSLITNVKTFEFGQTNPRFSHFLFGGFPLNGINFSYESKQRTLDFCHGQMVASTIIPMDERQKWINNMVQDIVPTSKNVGDRVTALSLSVFKSESVELKISNLYGIDKFISDTDDSGKLDARSVGRNNVTEFSATYIKNSSQIEMAYARSFMASGYSGENDGKTFSTNHNSAAWLKASTKWAKVKIEPKIELNYVESNFRSLGNPFLRNDVGRIDLGLKKKWESFSVSLTGRGQKNNLANSGKMSTELYSGILQCNWRIGKQVQTTLICSPIYTQTEVSDSKVVQNNQILQMGVVANYSYRKRDIFSVLMFSINRFTVTSENNNSGSNDYGVIWNVDWSKSFRQSTGCRYVESFGLDSLWTGKMITIKEDVEYRFHKKTMVTCGSSLLINTYNIQPGGRVGIKYQANKSFTISAQCEKIVLEGFYSQEVLKVYEKNPFRGNITLNYLL